MAPKRLATASSTLRRFIRGSTPVRRGLQRYWRRQNAGHRRRARQMAESSSTTTVFRDVHAMPSSSNFGVRVAQCGQPRPGGSRVPTTGITDDWTPKKTFQSERSSTPERRRIDVTGETVVWLTAALTRLTVIPRRSPSRSSARSCRTGAGWVRSERRLDCCVLPRATPSYRPPGRAEGNGRTVHSRSSRFRCAEPQESMRR